MKRTILLLLAATFSLSACEEVIDVDIPEGQPLLVVDGAVTDQPGPYLVKLTKTVPYFDEQALPPVPGAVLTISDNEGNREILREQAPGVYATNTFRGKIGNRYTLTIQAEGEEYQAETEIRRTPPIDSIRAEFREETTLDEEGYYVLYYGPELPGIGDYYRFKVFRNGRLLNRPSDLFVRSDELVDSRYIGAFELNNNQGEEETFELGDSIRVEMNSLPRDYYFFLNEVVTQLNNSGLFAAPPANVRTNVRNVQPKSPRKAVGYFAGYTVRQDSLVIK
ncbi:DUF4249 domain-containing protein [Hymenobacter terrenus]|uniref:DUF4249 domain-containing protein n=1 Tax=Hymenobacter terrenus TaxID=1629124 RepID=UPI0006197EAE|nr:DUF4249 domain-containing protein [Hymenobacter terrenus]